VHNLFIDENKEKTYYVMEYSNYKPLEKYIKKRKTFSGKIL